MVDKQISDLTALGAQPADTDIAEIERPGAPGTAYKVTYSELKQTGAQIKTAYEGEPDTNAFTDSEQTKLSGIATGAEVNPDVVSQAEAEAGTATTERIWTAERVKQGAVAAVTPGWNRVFKTSDEARASTTTRTDDGVLKDIALESGKTYVVRLRIFRKSTSSTPQYEFNLNYTGTTSGDSGIFGWYILLGGTGKGFEEQQAFDNVITGFDSNTGLGSFEFEAFFTTTSSGNLSLQWSQNVSDAADTVTLKGSYIEYEEVA